MSADVFPLTAGAIARAVGGTLVSGDPETRLPRASIDTRTLAPGDLFFALAGPRFDGHNFVDHAIARGAAGLVVSRPGAVPDGTSAAVVVVSDTLVALQQLAQHVRRLSGARVVAITGSAGKTTTKEATAAVLATRLSTLKNRGNLNNHIGLPLSLIDLQAGAQVAVLELGMNHAGEIRRLVEIAEPDVRVWTNVGTAHLEHFGSRGAIADAKAEILELASPSTVLVANADDERVVERIATFPGRVVTFGIDGDASVRARQVVDRGLDGMRAVVDTPDGAFELEARLPGRGHLMNLLAATAVAILFGIPVAEVAAQLAALAPAARRGEVVRLAHGVVVLDDCYNASPSALDQTLATIRADAGGRRRVAFIGEMLELGTQSAELHARAGETAAEAGIDALVTVGGTAAEALGAAAARSGVAADRVWHRATSVEAAELVPRVVHPGDLVLVKGSRGIAMERVVDRLKVEFG